ncbi:sodium:proton antiporter [Maribacter sp. SA7]|uniref:cation:proton antiporter n=1 Tax=Maribacter zhoushanensis TaxID=3030012 RepID=UPI0023ED3EC6|nr:sodium:proton antiporter [Maribacter zhoushanensis]MDF4204576.1 sodium:proton antiporter [Maribacter zhoushanensis]
MFQSFSIIFLIAAFFSYVNYKWLKLPSTIGLMILALTMVMLVTMTQNIFPAFYLYFCDVVINTDFRSLLMDGMLSFLLFAGSLHVNIDDLKKERKSILLFATLGVLISTAIVGFLTYFLAQSLSIELPLIHALLFGALISPTDPIAVMSILKKANIQKSLGVKIEGESLFNDGIGVVVFSGLLIVARLEENSNESLSSSIGELFLMEAVGGIVYGLLLGFIGYRVIKSINENPQLAVLISLAIVIGGYAIASVLHVSGPLAMVVSGMVIGNKINIASNKGMTRKILNNIWEVLDEVFNAILFVLIGLTIHLLKFDSLYLTFGFLSVLVVLLARFISVLLPYSLLKHEESKPIKTVAILTWGGLRGGISIALALSLSEDLSAEIILYITYVVVLVSVLLQGLTVGKVAKKIYS